MTVELDFLEWHVKEYGHAYNHNNDLIETAKKASRFAEAYHKAKVNSINDDDIENFVYDTHKSDTMTPSEQHALEQGAKWFKQKLLEG